MPYDPDWVSDEDGVGHSATAAEVPAAAEYSDQEEEPYGIDEGRQDLDEGDMDVDLPQPDPSEHEEKRDMTPRNRPHEGATAVAKPKQLAVVLHSSPRRDGFTPVNDAPDSGEGPTDLVTSDIVHDARIMRREASAVKATTALPAPQPPTSSVPFPIPTTITPQPKKRGRPFGWRLGSGPYSAMWGEAPSSAPRSKPKKPASSDSKPRRRPGRKPAPTARQVYLQLNPHFVSFRCEWENCPAELQNFETLRRHLIMVHGRPTSASSIPSAPSRPSSSTSRPSSSPQPPRAPALLTCKWRSCTHPPLPSRESFVAHIDETHMPPFLWHVGDGPRNASPAAPAPAPDPSGPAGDASARLPAYLLDARGVQVTPSVRDQQLENEDDRKKRQARINRILQQRDNNAPEEPQYTPDELAAMAAAVSEKKARQRMFQEYAERVCGKAAGVGGDGKGKQVYGPEWRGLSA